MAQWRGTIEPASRERAVRALRVVGDTLRRMQVHQVKKRPMLRKLRLAETMLPLRRITAVPDA